MVVYQLAEIVQIGKRSARSQLSAVVAVNYFSLPLPSLFRIYLFPKNTQCFHNENILSYFQYNVSGNKKLVERLSCFAFRYGTVPYTCKLASRTLCVRYSIFALFACALCTILYTILANPSSARNLIYLVLYSVVRNFTVTICINVLHKVTRWD